MQAVDEAAVRRTSRAKVLDMLKSLLSHFVKVKNGYRVHIQCESKKNPPPKVSDIFPKWLGIFSPNFTHLLQVPIYAGVQIFMQLPTTLTKLALSTAYWRKLDVVSK